MAHGSDAALPVRILSDGVEAGGLALERPDGLIARYKLDAGSVFEDRRACPIDLDDAGVTFLSEVPAIGCANRWLNPAGAADFDGDGHPEIAFVETPDIGGILRLYEFRDRKLHEDHAAPGLSDHATGSREQSQSAVHDWTGDGIADIAVPYARRRALRFVTFAGGTFREFETIAHDQPIVTAIRPARLEDGGPIYAVYGLADGRIVAVKPQKGP